MTSGAEVEDAHEQEIFEFPWVVFDVSSKQVVDDRTVYVKPTLHEELGVECAKAALGDDAEASMDGAGTLQQAVQVCPRPRPRCGGPCACAHRVAVLTSSVVAQEFNDYVYRSFIANNKDFCILTVSELPIKRWLWGEGPALCRGVWCGAVGRGDVSGGLRASPSSLAVGARREAGAGTRGAAALEGEGPRRSAGAGKDRGGWARRGELPARVCETLLRGHVPLGATCPWLMCVVRVGGSP